MSIDRLCMSDVSHASEKEERSVIHIHIYYYSIISFRYGTCQ